MLALFGFFVILVILAAATGLGRLRARRRLAGPAGPATDPDHPAG